MGELAFRDRPESREASVDVVERALEALDEGHAPDPLHLPAPDYIDPLIDRLRGQLRKDNS